MAIATFFKTVHIPLTCYHDVKRAELGVVRDVLGPVCDYVLAVC